MDHISPPGENTILVVDDEGFIRELFEDICADSGYGIRAAADAVEALAVLENEDINVIFLDLKLFGMNGIELCRRIRSEKPLAIIYAMTGWAGLYEVEECREAGFDDFFRKPLSVEQIHRAIVDALEKVRRWTRHGV